MPNHEHHQRNRWSGRPAVLFILFWAAFGLLPAPASSALTYPVVDTGQSKCYNHTSQITCPSVSGPFFGQDAQYSGRSASFRDNGNRTVSDLNTGLMWQQNLIGKMSYADALAGADSFSLAGYSDWRLPTIKELYSLIQFYGSAYFKIPYLDTGYFEFEWGDATGDRLIDSQFWSNTEYVGAGSTRFTDLVFGVNFADGRIKGYPREGKLNYVRYVRGNSAYGRNHFIDNGDGTITDSATGLMWQAGDSGQTLDWKNALAYAENLDLAGHQDWRLPNAKELQSIVDYTRAPDAYNLADRGPAIDPIFDITATESWFWTSTTHLDGPVPDRAVYITFGQATGYDYPTGTWVNVHGAGAQRSDPKTGNPDDYPYGHGPQNDEIRIFNYVRAVRNVSGGSTAYDFNDDLKPDILYRNPQSGSVGVWLMDNVTEKTWVPIGNHGTAWDLVGAADFDRDGQNDILYRHANGNIGLWLMDGVQENIWEPLTDAYGQQPANHGNWEIKGIADFNHDGHPDLLHRHPDTGKFGLWLMNGLVETTWVYVGNHGPAWDIKGVGDLNGDGDPDILYRHVNGTVGAWLMDGTSENTWRYIGNHGADWTLKGTRDLDGDGRTDLLYRHSNGNVGVWLMTGLTETTWRYIGNHGNWDIR